MPKTRLKQLREMLTQERAEILQTSREEIVGEGSLAHGDLADLTTDISERENLLALAEHDRERLIAIEQALEMIETGNYGICSICGEPIPDRRLLAIPTASLCVRCQVASERQPTE